VQLVPLNDTLRKYGGVKATQEQVGAPRKGKREIRGESFSFTDGWKSGERLETSGEDGRERTEGAELNYACLSFESRICLKIRQSKIFRGLHRKGRGLGADGRTFALCVAIAHGHTWHKGAK